MMGHVYVKINNFIQSSSSKKRKKNLWNNMWPVISGSIKIDENNK